MSKRDPLPPPPLVPRRSSTESESENRRAESPVARPTRKWGKSKKSQKERRRRSTSSRSRSRNESIDDVASRSPKLMDGTFYCCCCRHCKCGQAGPEFPDRESENAKRVRQNAAMKLTPKKSDYAADPLEDTMFMVRDRDDWSDSRKADNGYRFLLGKTAEYIAIACVTFMILHAFKRD